MTYQFDLRPEGLHYRSFYADYSRTAMWALRDHDGRLWVDLRSVFRVLLTSWPGRWRGYCEARQEVWGLEACFDRKLGETMLAPLARMTAVLGEIEAQLLKLGQRTAAQRARLLRQQWRRLHDSITCGEGVPSKALEAAAKRRPPAKRKVNAWVVRQAYQLLARGEKKSHVAKALQVSLATLHQLTAGTYPSLDSETTDAWWETFGAQKPAVGAITRSKTAASSAGRNSGSPDASGAPAGVLGACKKAGGKRAQIPAERLSLSLTTLDQGAAA